MTLGHMPREVSMGHGGGISREITGRRKRSAVPEISLKLVYTFYDPKADQIL